MLVSWRSLATDNENTYFKLYKNGEFVAQINAGEATNYQFVYENGILTITYPTGIQIVTMTRPVDIYTLSGVLVKRQVTTLKGLPDGLYIINGRKVQVKH